MNNISKPCISNKQNYRNILILEMCKKNSDYKEKREYLLNHNILETMKRSKK